MAAGRFTSRAPPPSLSAGLVRISDEGHRELESWCTQIRNRFGAQIDHARRTAKQWELARIIAHLQREQQAEVDAARRAADAKRREQQERLMRAPGWAVASRPLAAGQTTAPPQLPPDVTQW